VKHGKFALDDIPDETGVHVSIAMDENVSKRNNSAVLADALHYCFVNLGELCRASPIISNCRSTAERNMALLR